VQKCLDRFDEELAHLRRGYYAPEVRTASLVFDPRTQSSPAVELTSRITRPLSVLVVVEPSASAVPHPQVADGRLMAPHFALNDADRSALETALRLRDNANAPVTIQLAAVGPRGSAQALREAVSLGIDRVRLVVSEAEMVTPDSAASALAAVLGDGSAFNLVLTGGSNQEDEEGLVGRLTAAALGVPHVGRAAQLAAQKTDGEADVVLSNTDGREPRVRALPAAVEIKAGLSLRSFSMEGYWRGLATPIELERWPKRVAARVVHFEEVGQLSTDRTVEEQSHPLSPQEAARHALKQLGIGTIPLSTKAFEGAIEDVVQPIISEGSVVAVLAAQTNGRLHPTAAVTIRAAKLIATNERAELSVVLLSPQSEEAQRRAVADIDEFFRGNLVLWTARGLGTSSEMDGRLLVECWPFSALASVADRKSVV